MAENNEQQDTQLQETGGRQARICNALTFVGLFAVIIVGGYFILSDFEKEAEIKAAAPTAAPAVEPDLQLEPEAVEEEPLPELKEQLPTDSVDSTALDAELSDSVTVESPSHEVHHSADSLHNNTPHHAPVNEKKKHESEHEETHPAEGMPSE